MHMAHIHLYSQNTLTDKIKAGESLKTEKKEQGVHGNEDKINLPSGALC